MEVRSLIQLFSQYILNIVFYLIFVVTVGLILPNDKYIYPLMAILSPEQSFYNRVLAMEIEFEQRLYNTKSGDIVLLKEELVSSSYTLQIQEQLRRMALQYGLYLTSSEIDFNISNGEINTLKLEVSKNTNNYDYVNLKPIRVERLEVRVDSRNKKDISTKEQQEILPEIKQLKNTISHFYNIPITNIYIKYDTKH
jgi:hypothetical protein